jgi:hypothetical protein
MSGKKISDLPAAPYRAVMEEATARGKACLGFDGFNAEVLILAGLCDMVHELRIEVSNKPK